MHKLAIISSHPIQYYAPWFRYIVSQTDIDFKVFYLWDFGVTQQIDSEFKQAITWDIPLLDGYDCEFVPNTSQRPGTAHFWGLKNPTLLQQVKAFFPTAVLMMNYNYASLYRFMWQWDTQSAPLLFRGDSHRLFSASGIQSRLRRQWISSMYKRFSACLYVGKANFQYFTYHGVPPENLFFAPHSVDNQRFFAQAPSAIQQAKAWKHELGIPVDHQVILFAGKFSETKRPLDLLNAFLCAHIEKASLLFVGAGPLEVELKSTADRHPYVHFAPFQNQTQMPRTYATGDIVVLPSYGETWGLAINEAMCLSRPIIVSDHVGCAHDLVRSGYNGIVFPAGSVPALTSALKEATANGNQLRAWGKNSYEMIHQYSYAQTTSGLQQALTYLA